MFKEMPADFSPLVEIERDDAGDTIVRMTYRNIGLGFKITSLEDLPRTFQLCKKTVYMGWELKGEGGSGTLDGPSMAEFQAH